MSTVREVPGFDAFEGVDGNSVMSQLAYLLLQQTTKYDVLTRPNIQPAEPEKVASEAAAEAATSEVEPKEQQGLYEIYAALAANKVALKDLMAQNEDLVDKIVAKIVAVYENENDIDTENAIGDLLYRRMAFAAAFNKVLELGVQKEAITKRLEKELFKDADKKPAPDYEF